MPEDFFLLQPRIPVLNFLLETHDYSPRIEVNNLFKQLVVTIGI